MTHTSVRRASIVDALQKEVLHQRHHFVQVGLQQPMAAADQAAEALDRWVAWARRCRIESFVTLQRRIMAHRAQILASIAHGLSNGLIESVNTKIRLITRIAFGFANPDPLIALAMLTLGGHRPSLPGRTAI